jgi:hypothetical protein
MMPLWLDISEMVISEVKALAMADNDRKISSKNS